MKIINREYIQAMKTNSRLPFPYLVQLEITNVCPFHCPQCYKETKPNCHMNFEKLKDFVIQCYDNGTKLFVLNGGEPMLYYRINELLLFMNTLDIHMNCFTSGYGLTNDIIDLWNFDSHKLCLSLNGSTEEINRLTRQGYDITITAMKKLSELKKYYGINWVARHDNLTDFRNVLNLCEKYSVGFLFITSEKLTGTGKLMSPLTKDDYIVLSKIIENYSGNIEIIIESCFSTLDILLNKSNKFNYFMGCFAGKYGCHVDMNFSFSPCTHLAYYEKFSSLSDYWNNSIMLQQLNTDNKSDHCYYCQYHANCNPCKAWDERMYQNFSQDYISCPIFISNSEVK